MLSYRYAILDISTGQTVALSTPSELVTVNVLNDQIDVGVTASGVTVGGSLVVKIQVFRTVVNGSILFKDTTDYADTTATISLTESDAVVTFNSQLEFDHNLLSAFTGYAKPKFPTVAQNRLFVAHNTRNEVRFSFMSQDGPMPESFPVLNFISVEGKSGAADSIVGLAQIKGIPIVLKERSIGRLEEIGAPEITRAEDPVVFTYREISDTIGAVSHFAQTQVFDELIFLSRDNIYATNGQSIRPIAELISDTIKSIDFSSAKKSNISMVNDTLNKRLYVSVHQDTTDAQPNLILVGDYDQYPNFRWTFYTEGSNKVTHPGIRAGSFFERINSSNGSREMYFGNTDENGQYYKMDDGLAD
jgi:hypothetical protein